MTTRPTQAEVDAVTTEVDRHIARHAPQLAVNGMPMDGIYLLDRCRAMVIRLAGAVEALATEREAAEEQVIAIEGPGIPWDSPVPDGYILTAAAVNARIAKARLSA